MKKARSFLDQSGPQSCSLTPKGGGISEVLGYRARLFSGKQEGLGIQRWLLLCLAPGAEAAYEIPSSLTC